MAYVVLRCDRCDLVDFGHSDKSKNWSCPMCSVKAKEGDHRCVVIEGVSCDDKPSLMKVDDYMTIGESAKFLGVSSNTLRNWEKSRKLIPGRSLYSGYRLYRKKDLERVLKEINARPMR